MPFFTTLDGCRLFYEIRSESADRTFLVFLNGFTQTTVYWYGRVPVFKKQFSILLYDATDGGAGYVGLAAEKLPELLARTWLGVARRRTGGSGDWRPRDGSRPGCANLNGRRRCDASQRTAVCPWRPCGPLPL